MVKTNWFEWIESAKVLHYWNNGNEIYGANKLYRRKLLHVFTLLKSNSIAIVGIFNAYVCVCVCVYIYRKSQAESIN